MSHLHLPLRGLGLLALLHALGCGAAPAPALADPSEGSTTQPATHDPDGDRLLDEVDACPCIAEDFDGFDDRDGCPEIDNDHDGMHDACDACPNEPETYRDARTREGCPDVVGPVDESRMLAPQYVVHFAAQSSRVAPRDEPTLAALARVLAEQPRLLRVSVHGHAAANERGADALAVARDDAVRMALVALGVDAARLVVVAHGSAEPLDPRTTRDAHARNRRVTFAIDAFAPEEPVPNARARIDECDVPPPVDVCVAPAEAVPGSPP